MRGGRAVALPPSTLGPLLIARVRPETFRRYQLFVRRFLSWFAAIGWKSCGPVLDTEEDLDHALYAYAHAMSSPTPGRDGQLTGGRSEFGTLISAVRRNFDPGRAVGSAVRCVPYSRHSHSWMSALRPALAPLVSSRRRNTGPARRP